MNKSLRIKIIEALGTTLSCRLFIWYMGNQLPQHQGLTIGISTTRLTSKDSAFKSSVCMTTIVLNVGKKNAWLLVVPCQDIFMGQILSVSNNLQGMRIIPQSHSYMTLKIKTPRLMDLVCTLNNWIILKCLHI